MNISLYIYGLLTLIYSTWKLYFSTHFFFCAVTLIPCKLLPNNNLSSRSSCALIQWPRCSTCTLTPSVCVCVGWMHGWMKEREQDHGGVCLEVSIVRNHLLNILALFFISDVWTDISHRSQCSMWYLFLNLALGSAIPVSIKTFWLSEKSSLNRLPYWG